MTKSRWLFWHRRDLRLSDNLGLAAAAAMTPALTGVFVVDPESLAAMAPARRWFLAESLVELQQSWQKAGSRLLIAQGDALQLLPRLAALVAAETVAWNRDVEPAQCALDRQLAERLQLDGRKISLHWDQTLIPPDKLQTGAGNPYKVFGPFCRNWRRQLAQKALAGSLGPEGLSPLGPPKNLQDLDPKCRAALEQQGLAPSRQEPDSLLQKLRNSHGFKGVDLCPCRPGEVAAKEQLTVFCERGLITAYEIARNLPAETGTSGLSAALNFGTISPRQVWHAAQASRELCRSQEEEQSINIWEQELAWREFYQQALFHFPELEKGPFRAKWAAFPWENCLSWFEAWCEGLTGVPIVDAAMRQLVHSGWMHNRCRMIVASFLVKDLICDWRWGETFFMQHLVDGDLAANNGGWQWSAGSGMDQKPLRIFNPYTQASKFDPDASYIRRWLPELAHVSTADLISGRIPSLERRGYPEPVVEHKLQQARFRAYHATI
ncbi:MAG: FAD-binding domain-containing protein [Prochlorococcaceae cyanobacterium ETNP18_MAG_1]|nr:FAD-binding domain-containing protein [Prochlorococcaceae cyanobacterium ETNP18_MAG_1]